MKKVLVPAFAALLMSASVAQAVEITYQYDVAADGSGKTSRVKTNTFVETFDKADGTGGLTMSQDLVKVTTVNGGGFGFAKGDRANVYAAPAADSTHFAYGPNADSGFSNAEVNFNYAGLLSTLGTDATFNYFGLYYGSIDTFNDVSFYNAAGSLIQTITGTQLISQFGGISGDTDSNNTNLYVNLVFSAAEEFTSFSFNTSSQAFEVDNLVVGYDIPSQVPEPGSLALLGLGLAGAGLARRRNKK
jgi:hypothetical protein